MTNKNHAHGHTAKNANSPKLELCLDGYRDLLQSALTELQINDRVVICDRSGTFLFRTRYQGRDVTVHNFTPGSILLPEVRLKAGIMSCLNEAVTEGSTGRVAFYDKVVVEPILAKYEANYPRSEDPDVIDAISETDWDIITKLVKMDMYRYSISNPDNFIFREAAYCVHALNRFYLTDDVGKQVRSTSNATVLKRLARRVSADSRTLKRRDMATLYRAVHEHTVYTDIFDETEIVVTDLPDFDKIGGKAPATTRVSAELKKLATTTIGTRFSMAVRRQIVYDRTERAKRSASAFQPKLADVIARAYGIESVVMPVVNKPKDKPKAAPVVREPTQTVVEKDETIQEAPVTTAVVEIANVAEATSSHTDTATPAVEAVDPGYVGTPSDFEGDTLNGTTVPDRNPTLEVQPVEQLTASVDITEEIDDVDVVPAGHTLTVSGLVGSDDLIYDVHTSQWKQATICQVGLSVDLFNGVASPLPLCAEAPKVKQHLGTLGDAFAALS